jgi:hypothetical protein
LCDAQSDCHDLTDDLDSAVAVVGLFAWVCTFRYELLNFMKEPFLGRHSGVRGGAAVEHGDLDVGPQAGTEEL